MARMYLMNVWSVYAVCTAGAFTSRNEASVIVADAHAATFSNHVCRRLSLVLLLTDDANLLLVC